MVEQTGTDPEGNPVTFWRVDHGVDYSDGHAIYREPARLGGDNFLLGGSDTGSFWFGIAGPDLTPIHHRGQVDLYFDETGDEEDYQLLVAQFDDGDFLRVNGVEPE